MDVLWRLGSLARSPPGTVCGWPARPVGKGAPVTEAYISTAVVQVTVAIPLRSLPTDLSLGGLHMYPRFCMYIMRDASDQGTDSSLVALGADSMSWCKRRKAAPLMWGEGGCSSPPLGSVLRLDYLGRYLW